MAIALSCELSIIKDGWTKGQIAKNYLNNALEEGTRKLKRF